MTTSKSRRTAPNNICSVYFVNKGIEFISLPSILNHPDITKLLPTEDLQTRENIPVVTYSLSNTIRNKIFNYKDTVESINITNINSYIPEPCDCHNSEYIDKDHKHVLTGDLRIVGNSKLRKLLSKGPNFREPRSINYKKCLETIKTSLDTCIDSLSTKTNLPTNSFDDWKLNIISHVEIKISKLKTKNHLINTKKSILEEDQN